MGLCALLDDDAVDLALRNVLLGEGECQQPARAFQEHTSPGEHNAITIVQTILNLINL